MPLPPEQVGPMGRGRTKIRMLGKVALEEAIKLPDDGWDAATFARPGAGDQLAANLEDIHGPRLQAMNDNNVEMMVLSLTSPGIQGITDPKEAEVRTKINPLPGSLRNPD